LRLGCDSVLESASMFDVNRVCGVVLLFCFGGVGGAASRYGPYSIVGVEGSVCYLKQ
jgi:hypothetical protein